MTEKKALRGTNVQRRNAVARAAREVSTRVEEYARARERHDAEDGHAMRNAVSEATEASWIEAGVREFAAGCEAMADGIIDALGELRAAAYDYNTALDADSPVFAAAGACAAVCGRVSPFGDAEGSKLLQGVVDSCDCPAAAAYARAVIAGAYCGRETDSWSEADGRIESVQSDLTARVPPDGCAQDVILSLNSVSGAWERPVRAFLGDLNRVLIAVGL